MKPVLSVFLLILSVCSARAQFPGHYTFKTGDAAYPEVHLLLEEGGGLYLFSEDLCYKGVWTPEGKDQVTLRYNTDMDAVDLYAFSDPKAPGSLYFHGFGDQKAFLNPDTKNRRNNTFTPVYSERPPCAYTENLAIRVDRKDLAQVAIALNKATDTSKERETLFDVYTFTVPEQSDAVYLVVNKNALSQPRTLTLALRDGKYILNDKEQLEKQKTGSGKLAPLIAARIKQAKTIRTEKFRKEHYWLKTSAVQKIEPERSRKAIKINDGVIFKSDCPEVDPFPPIAPGR